MENTLNGPQDNTGIVSKQAASAATNTALNVAVEVLEDIQNIVSRGRPKMVKIKFGDRVIAEMPVALTAVAAFAAGLTAVLLTKLAVEVEHED